MPTQKVDFLPFAGYNVGNVSVAQLDRVTASDAVGFGFDSRQAHHTERKSNTDLRSFLYLKIRDLFGLSLGSVWVLTTGRVLVLIQVEKN